MAKKRSCRRTADENKIHEKAVKWRKMTDEQLVHYVDDRVERARSDGFNQGKKEAPVGGLTVAEFISDIENIKGIGFSTIWKIKDFYRKKGLLNE